MLIVYFMYCPIVERQYVLIRIISVNSEKYNLRGIRKMLTLK